MHDCRDGNDVKAACVARGRAHAMATAAEQAKQTERIGWSSKLNKKHTITPPSTTSNIPSHNKWNTKGGDVQNGERATVELVVGGGGTPFWAGGSRKAGVMIPPTLPPANSLLLVATTILAINFADLNN
eukprot:1587325-Pleurochrysis_carterae.AAC.1